MKKWRGVFLLAVWPAMVGAVEPVTVKPFAEIAIYLDRQAAASVTSLNEGVLSAEVSARVAETPVLPGQTVAAGELLVQLDDTEYRIGLSSAEARLSLADAALDMARIRAERARRLAPEQFVSEDQLLEAETNLRLADAERAAALADRARAELLLSRTRVAAPFAGVITQRLVSVGALAVPGTPLVELSANDGLEVSAMIPPAHVAGLKAADDLVFESAGREWPVQLARLSPVVDPVSRAHMARLIFSDDAAPSGSEGRIRWTDPRPALPGDYVTQRGGELGVLLLNADAGQAAFLPLPGADAGRPYLTDRLDADAPVIVDGRRRVQPGTAVEVVSP